VTNLFPYSRFSLRFFCGSSMIFSFLRPFCSELFFGNTRLMLLSHLTVIPHSSFLLFSEHEFPFLPVPPHLFGGFVKDVVRPPRLHFHLIFCVLLLFEYAPTFQLTYTFAVPLIPSDAFSYPNVFSVCFCLQGPKQPPQPAPTPKWVVAPLDLQPSNGCCQFSPRTAPTSGSPELRP